MKNIFILGATGSIGTNTLNIIRKYPDRFKLAGFTAHSNFEAAIAIIKEFAPKYVCITDKNSYDKVKHEINTGEIKLSFGLDEAGDIFRDSEVNCIVNALVGSIGLKPTLAALDASKDVLFANKEVLVSAGHLVMKKIKEKGVNFLPIDSEHSAIFQCLESQQVRDYHRIILTSSGGPFRNFSKEDFEAASLEQALNHPTWNMGKKITIDSATMMNKALEVIEAHWLFDCPYEKIDITIHPQSIIHSMVEYTDGSILAQLSLPDMKFAIQYAMSYPERLDAPYERLDFDTLRELTFQKVDYDKFWGLKMAYDAGRKGGNSTTILNAANEEAVFAFLDGKIRFRDIYPVIEKSLEKIEHINAPGLTEILETEKETRDYSRFIIKEGKYL